MAKIQDGISDQVNTFNLNGLDYPKNRYEIFYDNRIILPDGTLDESKIRVGLRSIHNNISGDLQKPTLVKDWKDSSNVAYTSLTNLIGDLITFIGFNEGGGSGDGTAKFSGWIDYNNSSSSINLLANTWTDLPNDGAGTFSTRSPLPLAGDITELINSNTGALVFSDFKIGDSVYLRHDFLVNPDTNNATLELRYFIGQTGQEYPLNISVPRLDRGSGMDYQETGLFYIYMGDDNTRIGGARLQVRLSTSGTLSNNGIVINYNIF